MVRTSKAPSTLPWRMMQEVQTRDEAWAGWTPSTAQLAWCAKVRIQKTTLSISLELVFDWRCRHLIFIEGRPSAARALLLERLRHAGFDVSKSTALRLLPGMRALDAEIAWIQRVAVDHGELLAPPPPPEPLAVARRSFRRDAFDRAAAASIWSAAHAFVRRSAILRMPGIVGWRVQAFCSAGEEEDGEELEVMGIVDAKGPSTKREASRVCECLSAVLAPFGFDVEVCRGSSGWYVFFKKTCATLTQARRERRRLERILFAR